MSHPQVEFSVLLNSTKIHQINQSKQILIAASNNRNIVTVADNGLPTLLNLKREEIKSFQNPKQISFTRPTAIAVDRESNYIITGHSDGSICVFSTKSNYNLLTTFKYEHKTEISAIQFSPEPGIFNVGDLSGVTTRVSVGKVFSTMLKEKVVYQDPHPVQQILFTRPNFPFSACILVYSNHFVLLDITRESDEQVCQRSNDFLYPPFIVFKEGAHATINLYVFENRSCTLYTLENSHHFRFVGTTVLLKSANENVIQAFLWNSRMIAIVTNVGLTRFINITDLNSSLEKEIHHYEDKIVDRKQSPLSQAILSYSVHMASFDEILYCVIPSKVVKLTFTPWTSKVRKFVSKLQWSDAFSMIVNISKMTERDQIGLPDRASEQQISIKSLSQEIITQFIEVALSAKNSETIKSSVTESIRLASQVGIEKFMIDEILHKLVVEGYEKYFYDCVFQDETINTTHYLTPDFVMHFLSLYREKNDLQYAENCLLKVEIPQNYSKDIASIIYEFGLMHLFMILMIYSFYDFITPCIILQDDFEKFSMYLSMVFSDRTVDARSLKIKKYARLSIFMWLFCPLGTSGFSRLAKLIENNFDLAVNVLKVCSELLPLQYSPLQMITETEFCDCIMQILSSKTTNEGGINYEKSLPILNIVCPLYAREDTVVTKCALPLTVHWCFHCHEQPHKIRISILTKIRRQYECLITDEQFLSYSIAAGFRFAIEQKYLPSKDYDIIIQSLLTNSEGRSDVFNFIFEYEKEDHQKMKDAIISNVDGLLLVNSDHFVSLLTNIFPELIDDIQTCLSSKLLRYLFLNSLLELDESKGLKHIDELFELICELNQSIALSFFTDHQKDLNLEKSKECCLKFQITECLISIAKIQNNVNDGIQATEWALINLLEMDGIDQITIDSTQQLAQYPELSRAISVVEALADFQNSIVLNGDFDGDDAMVFFDAFNFPFYYSRRKPQSVRKILFLIFAEFIVHSIQAIPVPVLFDSMYRHMCQFEFYEIYEVLTELSNEVEFKERLSSSLLEMAANDTCDLLDLVYQHSTKGSQTSVNVSCASCLKPLDPPQFGTALIFPCGHILHDEKECWMCKDDDDNPAKPTECPICNKGDDLEPISAKLPDTVKKLSKSQINTLLRRMEFALKRNYGSDINDYRPSSVYFAYEKRDLATNPFTLGQVKLTAQPIHITISDQ